MFREGEIPGVTVREFREFRDHRGWLSELYRVDELGDYRVAMAYLSVTAPGIVRGPHEHAEQTDYFCFLGRFSLYLWDNRKGSPGYRNGKVIENADRLIVTVPPGVVHAYRNSGETEGIVLNFPDRLYAGWGKKERVDEVRYEDDPGSPFVIER
ncbi:MAG: dTDP-4-dehydrorhamnose 3,5-epimerase family protein [Nitrospirae bacterium]|nr:dTDP-4-dehydrorhamnose 3,5-epimerase family protein [Nitrospirota bacterium]